MSRKVAILPWRIDRLLGWRRYELSHSILTIYLWLLLTSVILEFNGSAQDVPNQITNRNSMHQEVIQFFHIYKINLSFQKKQNKKDEMCSIFILFGSWNQKTRRGRFMLTTSRRELFEKKEIIWRTRWWS